MTCDHDTDGKIVGDDDDGYSFTCSKCGALSPPSGRYFVSMYTDGPSTRWNVIDRQTQEWVRRFSKEAEAQAYADELSRRATT
jgi:hypothetical protein